MKKKVLILVGILCGVMLLLSGCGHGAPSVSMMKDAIPTSILSYKIEDATYKFSINSFTLIRQKTDGKSDYAECSATLKGSYLDKDVILGFRSNYYDKGGWKVDSCSIIETKSEEYHDLKPLFVQAIIQELPSHGTQQIIKGSEPSNYTTDSYVYSDDEIHLRFDNQFDVTMASPTIAKANIKFDEIKYNNVTVSGFVAVKYEFNKSRKTIDYNNLQYETNYSWQNLTGSYHNPDLGIQLAFAGWHVQPDWSFRINKVNTDGSYNVTVFGSYDFGVLTKRMVPFEKTIDFSMTQDNSRIFSPTLTSNEVELKVFDTDGEVYTHFKVQLYVTPSQVMLYSNNSK